MQNVSFSDAVDEGESFPALPGPAGDPGGFEPPKFDQDGRQRGQNQWRLENTESGQGSIGHFQALVQIGQLGRKTVPLSFSLCAEKRSMTQNIGEPGAGLGRVIQHKRKTSTGKPLLIFLQLGDGCTEDFGFGPHFVAGHRRSSKAGSQIQECQSAKNDDALFPEEGDDEKGQKDHSNTQAERRCQCEKKDTSQPFAFLLDFRGDDFDAGSEDVDPVIEIAFTGIDEPGGRRFRGSLEVGHKDGC